MNKIKKIFSSAEVITAVVIICLLIAGTYSYGEYKKVKRLDVSCPYCGSCEVLDFGKDTYTDGKRGYCTSCEKVISYPN